MLQQLVIKWNVCAGKYRLYPGAVLLGSTGIMFFSIIPGVGGGINSGVAAHATAYFLLSLFLGLYLRERRSLQPALLGALLAGLYGAAVECVQYYIPYRMFDPVDCLVNFAAAFTGAVPVYFFIYKRWI